VQGERPSAYIIILRDKNIQHTSGCDHGIAAQSILLGATERGLGGCMIGAIRREKLRQALKIPTHFEILIVIALGKPKERVKIETVGPEGSSIGGKTMELTMYRSGPWKKSSLVRCVNKYK
jgi:hypothetical protein